MSAADPLSATIADLVRPGRAADLHLEPLALAHPEHLAEAQPLAGRGDGLPLRVVDLRLEHHLDDDSGHARSVRERPHGTYLTPRVSVIRR